MMTVAKQTNSGNYGENRLMEQKDFMGYAEVLPGGFQGVAMGGFGAFWDDVLGVLQSGAQGAQDKALDLIISNPEVQASMERSAYEKLKAEMAAQLASGAKTATAFWQMHNTKIMVGLGLTTAALTAYILTRK